MRTKRSSLEIKKEILRNLVDNSEKTFFHLACSCNTGTITIKDNCEELLLHNYIKIEKRGNSRIFNFVKITHKGRDFLKRL